MRGGKGITCSPDSFLFITAAIMPAAANRSSAIRLTTRNGAQLRFFKNHHHGSLERGHSCPRARGIEARSHAGQRRIGRQRGKSEGRRSKAERRPKPESPSAPGFGLRISELGLLSAFDLRPSTFGLRPSKLPHPTAPVEMLPRTGGGAEDLRLGVKAVTRTRSFPSASTN